MVQFDFKAVGTTWHIDIYRDLDKAEEADLLSKIKLRIEDFEKVYSRFRDDSLVTKISKEAGTFLLPRDAETMLSLYHDLYIRTGGFFTPLAGRLLSDAGYDAKYSLQQTGELKAPPAWDDVLDYKHPKLLVKEPVMLDFGAAGKGYIIDLIGHVLQDNDIFGYCIDAGGDILRRGSDSIRIGLEHPDNKDQVVGVYLLGNGAICGSAGNRRKWGDFTHIINPKTLTSPKDIKAVWVSAKTALLADALATCLFFVPADLFKGVYEFEYMIIRDDMSLEKSEYFSDEIFVS
ncbi:MAG: FAD:protein FMN transferase [Candidatus Taylorbacteria bacterium]